jgi:hypothetical protein
MKDVDWNKVEKYVKEIYRLASELGDMFPGRHFTPDGHLVGSLAEVHAAYDYGIELYPASNEMYDGTVNGKEVQIRARSGESVGIKGPYERLLVLKIFPNGKYENVYNGDGKRVWERLKADGNKMVRGEIPCRFSKLRELQKDVPPEDRLPKVR